MHLLSIIIEHLENFLNKTLTWVELTGIYYIKNMVDYIECFSKLSKYYTHLKGF